jgi:hypothetical protein
LCIKPQGFALKLGVWYDTLKISDFFYETFFCSTDIKKVKKTFCSEFNTSRGQHPFWLKLSGYSKKYEIHLWAKLQVKIP